MFRAIANKRIDLIAAALLPACVLIVGSIVLQSMAGGNPDEDFDPEDCEQYYRVIFGAETPWSNEYCSSNVLRTDETASFPDDEDNDLWNWDREQEWKFSVNMDWGTNSCNVTCEKRDVGVINYFGNSTNCWNGFWNGTESKWISSDKVYGTSDTHKWFLRVVNGTNYRCPKYRLHRTYGGYYDCEEEEHDYTGYLIQDKYNDPEGAMIYEGDSLVSTQADSGATYNCVPF